MLITTQYENDSTCCISGISLKIAFFFHTCACYYVTNWFGHQFVCFISPLHKIKIKGIFLENLGFFFSFGKALFTLLQIYIRFSNGTFLSFFDLFFDATLHLHFCCISSWKLAGTRTSSSWHIAHRVEQLGTYPIIRIPVQSESQKAEFFDHILLFYSCKQNHFR